MSKDEDEIRRLTYEYAWLVDTRQVDAMVELFTSDGWFDARPVGQDLMEGQDGIRHFFEEQNKLLERSVHVTTNHRIDVNGDEATGVAYVTVEGRAFDGSEITVHAYYQDGYRRTPDGWRFSSRTGVPFMPPKGSESIGATPLTD